MPSPPLRKRILNYLDKQPYWVEKGRLERLADSAGYLASTASRILRALAEEEEIQVSYYKGKRGQTLARYASRKVEKPRIPTIKIVEKDGRRVAQMS